MADLLGFCSLMLFFGAISDAQHGDQQYSIFSEQPVLLMNVSSGYLIINERYERLKKVKTRQSEITDEENDYGIGDRVACSFCNGRSWIEV